MGSGSQNFVCISIDSYTCTGIVHNITDVLVTSATCPIPVPRPCIAQWLERPLGVQEAEIRSPTASHQRRKNWEVCASQLGAWH